MNQNDRGPGAIQVSKVEERERLLAQAMAHAEARDELFRVLPADSVRRDRWKAPTALLLFMVAGVLLVSPPGWVAGPPIPTVDQGELERGLEAAIRLQVVAVETFRIRNGRLPDDLAELPTRLPGLRFVRSNSRVYQIFGRRPGGEMLVYDSAHPAAGFATAGAGWADGDGR